MNSNNENNQQSEPTTNLSNSNPSSLTTSSEGNIPIPARGFIFQLHIIPQSLNRSSGTESLNNSSSTGGDNLSMSAGPSNRNPDAMDTSEPSNTALSDSTPVANNNGDSNRRPERVSVPFAIVFEFDSPLPIEASLGLIQLLGGRIFGENSDDIINQLFQQYQPRPSPSTSKDFIEKCPVMTMTVDSNELCTVCQDVYKSADQAMKLPCTHLYHKDCILPWLETHNTCPTCRYELPTDLEENKVGGG